MQAEAALAHARYKHESHELRDDVAQRLIASLEGATGKVDYAEHLRAATFPPPPALLYHTAPRTVRHLIALKGLQVSQPGEDRSWSSSINDMLLHHQPPGIYCGVSPDTIGMWTRWPEWDVWEVVLGDADWRHDTLNPGCYRLVDAVAPDRLRLVV